MLKNLKVYDFQHRETQRAVDEILAGLTARRKHLPSYLLYDEQGFQLLEELDQQEDYYVSRTEEGLLEKYGSEIASLLGSSPFIFEFGAGNTRKVRFLLEHVHGQCSYMAVDLSKDPLLKNTEALARDFPNVQVFAVCADFTRKAALPPEVRTPQRKVFFFPGSTIGNMEPAEAHGFLSRIRELIGEKGAAVVGVDLRKDPEVLRRAYNDSSGLTSRMELHVLERLNKEYGANFNLDQFRHLATYHQKQGRVEMYLVSCQNQLVTLRGKRIPFRKGETIHIEDSFKYSVDEFNSLARGAGFRTIMTWLDKKSWFSMNLLLP